MSFLIFGLFGQINKFNTVDDVKEKCVSIRYNDNSIEVCLPYYCYFRDALEQKHKEAKDIPLFKYENKEKLKHRIYEYHKRNPQL